MVAGFDVFGKRYDLGARSSSKYSCEHIKIPLILVNIYIVHRPIGVQQFELRYCTGVIRKIVSLRND